MTIDFIGSGNVATRMACALHQAGHTIGRIASRTETHAAALASQVNASVCSPEQIDGADADLVILAVNDDAIAQILADITPASNHTIWTHTAGSVGIDVFDPQKFHRAGVFYPMQTMSRTFAVDWHTVPLFIEASDEQTESVLMQTASLLTPMARHLDSLQRRRLHAAAVFCCNITMHMWTLSEQILADAGLDFSLMHPLMDETLRRAKELSPSKAMTGPARRGDLNTIEKHIKALPPSISETYRFLSNEILKIYHPEYEQNRL